MSFFEKVIILCNKNGVSPNALCSALGLSNATATKWKKGAEPRYSTKKAIANYFGVTVDYLLSDQKEKPDTDVTPNGLSEDIKKLNEILKTLPPEKLKEIENYALFVQQQQNQ